MRSCGGGSRRSQAASRVITSATVVTSSADAVLAAMIGVVLIVAMRSGYWPVAGRHSLRGEALRERGFQISSQAIAGGLENASHAGRLELWPGRPALLFDGAHNPAAALVLRDYLDEFVRVPITFIFGAMKDKRLPEMAATLFPKAQFLILTQPDNPRAAEVKELAAAVPIGYEQARIRKAAAVGEALRIARELTPNHGLICVTGSLYLIGAVQQLLQESSAGFAQQRGSH